MPFDGADLDPPRKKPARGGAGDNLVTVLIVVLAICMLVMPISVASLMDTVRYLRGK